MVDRLPELIANMIGDRKYTIDNIGMSDSEVLVFDDMVLKIQPDCRESKNEREIMKWLRGKIPVPEILASIEENGTSYLLMTCAEGEMICDSRYICDPNLLVDALCDGLNRLWSMDVSGCPCDNRLDVRLRSAKEIVESGLVDLANVEPETFGENGFRDPEELLAWLVENRPVEDVVLSHGDYCLPNIFARDAQVTGFIDLGKAGIADRYQDIAIGYRSLKHNLAGLYGGHDPVDFDADTLFERLGIEPDWDKMRYFTLLDELF